MIGVKKRTVKILEYDPEWGNEYLKEKAALERVLEDYSFDIQHVGSTSNCGV